MSDESTEKPKGIEGQRQDSVKNIPGISPDQAKSRLERLGYGPHTWKLFNEDQDLGSHFVRALVHVAQGSQIRMLDDVYKELFPEHQPPAHKTFKQQPKK